MTDRVLVKMRPSTALRAAGSRVGLRPLYDTPPGAAGGFGLAGEAQWFVADLPEGAATPWDSAHSRVADQLGVAESDVLFAEPDLVHDVYRDDSEVPPDAMFTAGKTCERTPQDATRGKAALPDRMAWHLDEDFTQLAKARDAVTFSEPRTRVAHLDTGYYGKHETLPRHVLHDLEKSFVEGATGAGSAEDPDAKRLFDNSGHGTGTIGILAGGEDSTSGLVIGGAPEAAVLPLRVADRVVLLRTSALARALIYALQNGCDVATLSMGGLPSRAWAEAADAVYEGGLCLCAAAGNHVGFVPPHRVVYPARYDRVIAVCGVMADGRPYSNLKDRALEGSFGPESAMRTALAAYTPNIPWARFHCENVVRLNGEGTSSATPQVAAAATLWIEKYKAELPRSWRRVEALRNALFSTAQKGDAKHFGNGLLRAFSALAVRPVLAGLPMSPRSSNSFAFVRLVTGLGVVEAPPREQMFNLELTQRWLVNEELQAVVPDPEAQGPLAEKDLRRVMDAILADEGASMALRRHVAERYPVAGGRPAPRTEVTKAVVPAARPVCDVQPTPQAPPYRRLRVYAIDPSLSTRLETAGINEVTLRVPWEKLAPGPAGDYLAVDDVDSEGRRYDPVDLDAPELLAQDGWAPAEGNPQFHQQMVYGVAMKTIVHFEKALGRPILWRPRPNPAKPSDDSAFVRQLAVRPHALRQANAFYSPQEVALLFGYFEAPADQPGELMPGSPVYSCLSHDIVAHETTHAILDGMFRRFNEPTNRDVLALHEGFADIVALLQHFTIPEVLENEIRRTRGDIEAESMLGSLAVQFGRATGGRGALRDAIGRVEDGVWKRNVPDPLELERRKTPHSRGAVLVAAVFDAFLAIYKERIADLLRIATGGSGLLQGGSLHPDLVRRLAEEAAKSASHVLDMCIRALDYLPPVDVTFFEYLRALITADSDLVRHDRHNYRVAFVEAFRRRGIYPLDGTTGAQDAPRTLSVDTLRWQGIDLSPFTKKAQAEIADQYAAVIADLKRYADACLYLDDRQELFEVTREARRGLQRRLKGLFAEVPEFAEELGLDPEKKSFEVHELRRAMRISPDGRHVPQLVVALTQSTRVRASKTDGIPQHTFRGGSTLVVDLSVPEVKYRIVKRMTSADRRSRTAAHVRELTADPLRALLFGPEQREPFAALHTLTD